MSWQDGEPQHLGGCAYVDVNGAWRTTSCDTKLQGAMCGINGGECPPVWAEGWARRRRFQGGLWATSSILHPHRATPSPKNKLPWQLSPRSGRLCMDSLPGTLLLLPHGAAAGPQGGTAALPERWAKAGQRPRVGFSGGGPSRHSEPMNAVPLLHSSCGYPHVSALSHSHSQRLYVTLHLCALTVRARACAQMHGFHPILYSGCWRRGLGPRGRGAPLPQGDPYALTWTSLVSSGWGGPVHSG